MWLAAAADSIRLMFAACHWLPSPPGFLAAWLGHWDVPNSCLPTQHGGHEPCARACWSTRFARRHKSPPLVARPCFSHLHPCLLCLLPQFNQQLGHGAFKAVYKGYDEEEGIEVAWCQVNMERVGKEEKQQIQTEVDILKSLTHKVRHSPGRKPCAARARVPHSCSAARPLMTRRIAERTHPRPTLAAFSPLHISLFFFTPVSPRRMAAHPHLLCLL